MLSRKYMASPRVSRKWWTRQTKPEILLPPFQDYSFVHWYVPFWAKPLEWLYQHLRYDRYESKDNIKKKKHFWDDEDEAGAKIRK